MFGPIVHEENKHLKDLDARELGYMVPMVAMAILMGVFPNFFLSRMEPSVFQYLTFMNQKVTIAPGSVTVEKLRADYDAVLYCGGSETPREAGIPGVEFHGVHDAMPYLVQQNRRVGRENIDSVGWPADPILAGGKHVVVVGGGDTASDCVGTAFRQGAVKVTQLDIRPRPPETEDKLAIWPFWATKMRTSSSQAEGAIRRIAAVPKMPSAWVGTHQPKPEPTFVHKGGDPTKPAGQVVLAQLAAYLGVEGDGERAEIFLRQRHPGGHGMPAELADQPRMLGCNRVQRITDMQPRHRTRRALEHALTGIGEGDGRAVVTLLQARGEDADHPLVPVGLEQAQAERHVLQRQVLELGQRLALHALLDGLAILIELIELHRHVAGQRLVRFEVGQ